MDGERWVRWYRTVFFVALLAYVLVEIYFRAGFPVELANRARGPIDFNLWIARVGSVAWIITVGAGVAILISLAVWAYQSLGEPSADSTGSA